MSPAPLRRLLAALLVALLGVTLLAGCSAEEGTNEAGYIEGDGRVLEFSPGKRSEPVELSGETLEGARFDVADHRGKVVVVNVWWSGCGPCRSEMPMLVEAAQELGDTVFVGLNIRDNSRETALAFERTYGVDYPSLDASSDPAALLAFHGKVSTKAIPATVVLDREGRVAAAVNGPIPSKLTLTDVVSAVAAEDA